MVDVLDRGFLGMGSEVQEFEQRLSLFFDRPTVCVVNGTAALQLALEACGVRTGDEVLVPSLTYVASFQAISATGAKPVACEVNPDNGILDLADAELRFTERTKVIMPVHYSGDAGNPQSVAAFAKSRNLRVVEDAAHSFGSRWENKLIGSFGDISCFSFDGIKNITSGEGGCIVTSDEKILEHVRDARLLGVQKDTQARFSGKRTWEFDITAQGWRYHMSNIMAAIGIAQLNRFRDFSLKRQSLAMRYDSNLANLPGVTPFERDYHQVVPHIYPVRIYSSIGISNLQQKLAEMDIQTGRHYQPNHLLSLYKDPDALPFKKTEELYSRMITLPLHPDMDSAQIDYICNQLKAILASDN